MNNTGIGKEGYAAIYRALRAFRQGSDYYPVALPNFLQALEDEGLEIRRREC